MGGSQSQGEGEKEGEKDGKKKKSRCLSCKKKVGLTGKASIIPPVADRLNVPRVHLPLWRPVLLHTQIQ